MWILINCKINNSLNDIISDSISFTIPYHQIWLSFFRIGNFCFVTTTHICTGGSWATGDIFVAEQFRPTENTSIPNGYVEVRNDGTVAGLQEGGNTTHYGYVVYKCAS